jgi:2-iminoacetate synthase
MSFAEILEKTNLRELRLHLDDVSEEQVQRSLARTRTSFSDFLAMLSPVARNYLEPLAQRAHKITERRFGRVILLYAPLYLSNECTNACLYCGFNVNRTVPRITLSFDQILAEAHYLKGWGFRHVLLVCGEAPKVVPVALLERVLYALKDDLPSLSLEVYPLSAPAYEHVAQAGADGLVLYQETYDRDAYERVHPEGRKRDFTWRLTAAERGGDAGFRRLGIGALLGLHDWRHEGIALALHADYLMKHYWKTQITISFPRLRHTPETFVPAASVSDIDLVQLMLALRNYLPDAGMVISTREPAMLRDKLIPLGVTQMSAGSRTEPGGYLHPTEAGAQFEVEDHRSPQEVARVIREAGYEPVWKDWDREMRSGIAVENETYASHRQREAPRGA